MVSGWRTLICYAYLITGKMRPKNLCLRIINAVQTVCHMILQFKALLRTIWHRQRTITWFSLFFCIEQDPKIKTGRKWIIDVNERISQDFSLIFIDFIMFKMNQKLNPRSLVKRNNWIIFTKITLRDLIIFGNVT